MWFENRETEMGRAIYLEFISAKDRAMALAESLAMTRVRRGDADYSRRTGNLLYLSVIHEDARPVGSDVPDPMLHAHNCIFNLTWDEEVGRLKAMDLHDMLKWADTIDALFLSELERGLQRLGIGTGASRPLLDGLKQLGKSVTPVRKQPERRSYRTVSIR